MAALRRLSLSACGFMLVCMAACKHEGTPSTEDLTDSAVQEVEHAFVRRSEKGNLQTELYAPKIKKYQTPHPHTVFLGSAQNRVQLRIYDDQHQVKALIEANNAVSYDDRNVMEAHDSVVVIDYRGGDTIYLQDIVWNSPEDRIYSDHPVRSRNGSRLTEGDGFTSNERMDNMHIIRQRGVIEFTE